VIARGKPKLGPDPRCDFENANDSFPFEQKLFHLYTKSRGKKSARRTIEFDRTSGVTPHAPGVGTN